MADNPEVSGEWRGAVDGRAWPRAPPWMESPDHWLHRLHWHNPSLGQPAASIRAGAARSALAWPAGPLLHSPSLGPSKAARPLPAMSAKQQ